MSAPAPVDRYRVNDYVTGLFTSYGKTLDDDVLNELTHQVANVLDMTTPVLCSTQGENCEGIYDEARGDGYAGTCPVCADRAHAADETSEGRQVTVIVTKSAGKDGGVLIFIDTPGWEPDASDGGPGLRVLVNDGEVYEGVQWAPRGDDQMHQFESKEITVNVDALVDDGLVY